MTRILIEVGNRDADDIHTLHELERQMFPGEHRVHPSFGCYFIELTGERARYVLDQLRIETEDAAFESFAAWKARSEDQGELDLGRDGLSPQQRTALENWR